MSIIDKLLEKHSDLFNKSITHPLTYELCAGTLADYRLYTYLTQDLKFFQIGLNLIGKTLSLCDNPQAAITLGKQIGFLSNDENDYFFKALSEIEDTNREEIEKHASKMLGDDPITLSEVNNYINLLKYLTYESTSYIELITFTYVMEKVYLGWAQYNIDRDLIPQGLGYKYQEWINLHSGEAFTKWVEFLKGEVERVVKTKEDEELCEKTFVLSVEQEIAFFEDCYNYKE